MLKKRKGKRSSETLWMFHLSYLSFSSASLLSWKENKHLIVTFQASVNVICFFLLLGCPVIVTAVPTPDKQISPSREPL